MKLFSKRPNLAEIFNRENNEPLTTLSVGAAAPDAVQVKDGNAPDEILLLSWGPQPDPLGYVVVDANTLATLPKLQAALDALTIPIMEPGDPTLNDDKEATEEPTQVGSGRVVVRDKDGIYLTDIQWLDGGLAALAEFPAIAATVWLQGDLSADGQKSVVGVKSATFGATANQIVMLDMPKLVNLSAAAQFAGYNRIARTMNAENASATGDRVQLIKSFAANGKFPRHENGQLVSEQQMSVLNLDALRVLWDKTPISAPNSKDEIIRCFSSTGKMPRKTASQLYSVDELRIMDLGLLKLLYANIQPLTARS